MIQAGGISYSHFGGSVAKECRGLGGGPETAYVSRNMDSLALNPSANNKRLLPCFFIGVNSTPGR